MEIIDKSSPDKSHPRGKIIAEVLAARMIDFTPNRPRSTRKYNFSLIMHATGPTTINHPERATSLTRTFQAVRFVESSRLEVRPYCTRKTFARFDRFEHSVTYSEKKGTWIDRSASSFQHRSVCFTLFWHESTRFEC